MANEEQLKILQVKGVDAWNKWREENPHVEIDLSEIDLHNPYEIGELEDFNFNGANLSKANLSHTTLWRVDLSSVNFSGADLSNADLTYSRLKDADLSDADLSGANFGETDFSDANLSGINLSGARFSSPNFSRVDLSGINFSGLSLSRSNFSDANLSRANFSGVNLSGADFSRANLIDARLEGANLSGANFSSANLSRVNLSNANFRDKTKTIFSGANLSEVNFFGVNLESYNFSDVNFSGANLSKVQALTTNFKGATFTGACIQDWNTNSETNFENVICDYFYLKEGKQERRPCDPNRNFEPGEFAKLVQKSLETVDFIFSKGIDWQSFLQSFQDLQVEDANEQIAIQTIERKTGGAFVIRVEVPPDADKASIEESFWQKYNPLIEAKDREIKLLSQQTEFYSQQIEVIRTDNTRLIGIVETMAEKETVKVQQNFNAPVSGVAGNIEGNQNIFSSPSITQASSEIQILLTTLQNNGLTQEQAEGIVANNLATQAKDNPTALGKLVNWGKSLGNKAAETSVSEVARRVIKLALNLAGVPLP